MGYPSDVATAWAVAVSCAMVAVSRTLAVHSAVGGGKRRRPRDDDNASPRTRCAILLSEADMWDEKFAQALGDGTQGRALERLRAKAETARALAMEAVEAVEAADAESAIAATRDDGAGPSSRSTGPVVHNNDGIDDDMRRAIEASLGDVGRNCASVKIIHDHSLMTGAEIAVVTRRDGKKSLIVRNACGKFAGPTQGVEQITTREACNGGIRKQHITAAGWFTLESAVAVRRRVAGVAVMMVYHNGNLDNAVIDGLNMLRNICTQVYFVAFVDAAPDIAKVAHMENVAFFLSPRRDPVALGRAIGLHTLNHIMPAGASDHEEIVTVGDMCLSGMHVEDDEVFEDNHWYIADCFAGLLRVVPPGAGVKWRCPQDSYYRFGGFVQVYVDQRCYETEELLVAGPGPSAASSTWAANGYKHTDAVHRHDNVVRQQVGGSCYLHAVVNALKDGCTREVLMAHCTDIVAEFPSAVDDASAYVREIADNPTFNGAVNAAELGANERSTHVTRCALMLQLFKHDQHPSAAMWLSEDDRLRERTPLQNAYAYIATLYTSATDVIQGGGQPRVIALALLHGLVSNNRSWHRFSRTAPVEIPLSRHIVVVHATGDGENGVQHVANDACGVYECSHPQYGHAVAFTRGEAAADASSRRGKPHDDGTPPDVQIGESGGIRPQLGLGGNQYVPYDFYRDKLRTYIEETLDSDDIRFKREIGFRFMPRMGESVRGGDARLPHATATIAKVPVYPSTQRVQRNTDAHWQRTFERLHSLETALLALMCACARIEPGEV